MKDEEEVVVEVVADALGSVPEMSLIAVILKEDKESKG